MKIKDIMTIAVATELWGLRERAIMEKAKISFQKMNKNMLCIYKGKKYIGTIDLKGFMVYINNYTIDGKDFYQKV